MFGLRWTALYAGHKRRASTLFPAAIETPHLWPDESAFLRVARDPSQLFLIP
jgi:hypothetical protein